MNCRTAILTLLLVTTALAAPAATAQMTPPTTRPAPTTAASARARGALNQATRPATQPTTRPVLTPAEVIQRIKAYAPPNALGVLHADIAAMRDSVVKALKRNPEAAKLIYGNAIIRAFELVDAANVYFVPHPDRDEPEAIVVVHGRATPKDAVAFFDALREREVALEAPGNGRYAMPRLEIGMVYEPEASDRKGSALIFGHHMRLTDELLASLGKETSETLAGMLAKANTKAQAWMAVDFSVFPEDDAPTTVIGYLDLGRKVALDLAIAMREAESATRFVEMFAREGSPFQDQLSVVADGLTVRLTAAGGKDALDKFLTSVQKLHAESQRAAAQSRLRWIGSAVESYQAEHGVPPAGLVVLIESGELSAWALVSPNSDRHELETDDKGVPTEPGDYEYLVLPTGAPRELIRAYERPDLHAGQGTNVLLADGSVTWLVHKEFEKRLAATQDWLAKQSR